MDQLLGVDTVRHPLVSTDTKTGRGPKETRVEQRPDPLKRLYGTAFAHYWRLRGASATRLAAGALCDSSYLYLIRDGRRLPNAKISKRLDDLLEAGGLLVTLGETIEEEARRAGRQSREAPTEGHMQRRKLLQQALAALAAGTAGTAAALETIRDGLAATVTAGESMELDIDEWGEVAWEYGRSYLTTAPEVLTAELAADVVDVQLRLDQEDDDCRIRELSRVSAQLAALMAMSLINLRQIRAANRWWRTARWAADASEDTPTRAWVRAEEAIRALYTHRSPQVSIDLADQALALGGQVTGGKAMAAKAQGLALMGRVTEARSTVQAIEPVVERMPPSLIADEDTVYGWPEHCLRHTESFVFSHIGDTSAAATAQQRALALYPPTECRARALVELHQAMCLVTNNYIDDGAHHAQRVIAALPSGQITSLVLKIGQQVLRTVPVDERRRESVSGLYELLALPPGRAGA